MMQETPEGSFIASIEPLRPALRVHCYRMLGSSHDGEDVVQETMIRAWRSRDTLKDPALLRPWIYRIATNTCLDELKRRPRRVLASDVRPPAADPRAPIEAPIDEPVWLEPMPDTWLASNEVDPAARYTLKESVALAFVAALQCLTPPQRATLLLRDVVGLSAEETAAALEMNVGAVNSALFRAREAIEARVGTRGSDAIAESGAVDEELLARYIKAFESRDAERFAAFLHEDIQTTMPPSPMWISGLAANVAFYTNMFEWARPTVLAIRRTAANGQMALAFYRGDPGVASKRLTAIQVLTFRAGLISRIDHFMTKESFGVFGLPIEIPG